MQHSFLGMCWRKSRNSASAIAKFLHQSSVSSFIMSPICDGDARPVAKQATNDHRADRERQKHKAIKSRNTLRSLNRELNCSQLSPDDRSALITRRGKLERGIKTSETQSSAAVPTNFPALLQQELDKFRGGSGATSAAGGSVGRVQTALSQADALIIGRYFRAKCQLLLSTDVDFIVFGGDKCILVAVFTKGQWTIKSTSKSTIEEAISWLPAGSKKKIKII